MPMQPRPCAETVRPDEPRTRVGIAVMPAILPGRLVRRSCGTGSERSAVRAAETGGAAVTQQTTDLPAGVRRGADRAYAYVAALFMLGLLVQFYLAGVGVFGDHARNVEDATSFDAHRNFGFALGIVALVLFVLALIARVSRAVVIATFVVALLAIVLQSLLAGAGNDNKWVGGLHAFDGVVILLLAGWLTGSAHRREGARRRAGATTAA